MKKQVIFFSIFICLYNCATAQVAKNKNKKPINNTIDLEIGSPAIKIMFDKIHFLLPKDDELKINAVTFEKHLIQSISMALATYDEPSFYFVPCIYADLAPNMLKEKYGFYYDATISYEFPPEDGHLTVYKTEILLKSLQSGEYKNYTLKSYGMVSLQANIFKIVMDNLNGIVDYAKNVNSLHLKKPFIANQVPISDLIQGKKDILNWEQNQLAKEIAKAKLTGQKTNENATETEILKQEADVNLFNELKKEDQTKKVNEKAKTISKEEIEEALLKSKENEKLYFQHVNYDIDNNNDGLINFLPIEDANSFKIDNTKKFVIKSGSIHFENSEEVINANANGESPVIGNMGIEINYNNKTDITYKFIGYNYASVNLIHKNNANNSLTLGTGNTGKINEYSIANFTGKLHAGIKVDKNGNYILWVQAPKASVFGNNNMIQITEEQDYGIAEFVIDLEMKGKLKDGQLRISGVNVVKTSPDASMLNIKISHFVKWDVELEIMQTNKLIMNNPIKKI